MALNYNPGKKVISNLDKDWYMIIRSIKDMNPAVAEVMLHEMYEKIPILFGFPKKKLMMNEYDDTVMMSNPDYYDAVDWINYHAGWDFDREGNIKKHRIRELNEKFVLNRDLWR